MVRAKFYVSTISKSKMGQQGEIGTTVHMSPVVSGSDENKKFFLWTPFGRVEIGTLNEEASRQFEVGKCYYLDFTEAPD